MNFLITIEQVILDFDIAIYCMTVLIFAFYAFRKLKVVNDVFWKRIDLVWIVVGGIGVIVTIVGVDLKNEKENLSRHYDDYRESRKLIQGFSNIWLAQHCSTFNVVTSEQFKSKAYGLYEFCSDVTRIRNEAVYVGIEGEFLPWGEKVLSINSSTNFPSSWSYKDGGYTNYEIMFSKVRLLNSYIFLHKNSALSLSEFLNSSSFYNNFVYRFGTFILFLGKLLIFIALPLRIAKSLYEIRKSAVHR